MSIPNFSVETDLFYGQYWLIKGIALNGLLNIPEYGNTVLEVYANIQSACQCDDVRRVVVYANNQFMLGLSGDDVRLTASNVVCQANSPCSSLSIPDGLYTLTLEIVYQVATTDPLIFQVNTSYVEHCVFQYTCLLCKYNTWLSKEKDIADIQRAVLLLQQLQNLSNCTDCCKANTQYLELLSLIERVKSNCNCH